MTKNTLKTLKNLCEKFGDKQFSFDDVKSLCPAKADPQKVFANLRHKKSLFIKRTRIGYQSHSYYTYYLTSKGKKVWEFGFNKSNKIDIDNLPNDWFNIFLLNYLTENPYHRSYPNIAEKIGFDPDDINHAALALKKEGKLKITKSLKKWYFQVIDSNVNQSNPPVPTQEQPDICEVLANAIPSSSIAIHTIYKPQEVKGQLSLFDESEKAPSKTPSGVFRIAVDCSEEMADLAKTLGKSLPKLVAEIVAIGYQTQMSNIQTAYEAEQNGE